MIAASIPPSLSEFDSLDDELKSPVEMLLSDSVDDRIVGVVSLQHLCDEESVPFLIHALHDLMMLFHCRYLAVGDCQSGVSCSFNRLSLFL